MTFQDIPNELFAEAANNIKGPFTILTIIEFIERDHPSYIKNLKDRWPRNWRSVIGKQFRNYLRKNNHF